MKRILLLMAAVAALCFAGCSKDEGGGSKIEGSENLVGKWTATHANVGSGYVNMSQIPQFANTTLTFGANNSFAGTGLFDGFTGTYGVANNMITCYYSGVPYFEFEIKSLSSSICELYFGGDGSYATLKFKKDS